MKNNQVLTGFAGTREVGRPVQVWVLYQDGGECLSLEHSRKIRNFESGLEWEGGSVQLAFAMLLHCFEQACGPLEARRLALERCEQFSIDVVEHLPHLKWEVTASEIKGWLDYSQPMRVYFGRKWSVQT